jgi:hypothetical protein
MDGIVPPKISSISELVILGKYIGSIVFISLSYYNIFTV